MVNFLEIFSQMGLSISCSPSPPTIVLRDGRSCSGSNNHSFLLVADMKVDMVDDMVAEMVAEMVADIVAHMVADMVADMEVDKVGHTA